MRLAEMTQAGFPVPEGLVLMTSLAFAVGVVRLGRRQCLVQELPAIERKPEGHDFDYSRQTTQGQMSRHMSHTGG